MLATTIGLGFYAGIFLIYIPAECSFDSSPGSGSVDVPTTGLGIYTTRYSIDFDQSLDQLICYKMPMTFQSN